MIRIKQIDGLQARPRGMVEILSAKIERSAFVEAIAVIELPGKRYLLIDGHIRVHACKLLGKKEIPAKVYRSEDFRSCINSNPSVEGTTGQHD